MDYDEILKKSEELLDQAKSTWQSDEVQSKVTFVKTSAKELVEKYPVGSLAGALLLGYIAGRMLKSEDGDE